MSDDASAASLTDAPDRHLWPAAGAAISTLPGAPAASAVGTLTDGAVRVVVVARSTVTGHALDEAERAVAVALQSARTMLGATGRDLDATQQALGRAILNRWRHGRPEDLPVTPGGQGTSVVIVIASGSGGRLTAFGDGYAAALAADGQLLALDPGVTAHDHGPGPDDESPDDDPAEEIAEDPTGLDHPEAAARVRHRRISSTDRPRLLWASAGPVPVGETPDIAWQATLRDIADRLGRHDPTSPVDPANPVDLAAPAGAEGATGAESEPAALATIPSWLPPLLPESLSALALTWPPAHLVAAAAEAKPGRRQSSRATAKAPRQAEPATAPPRPSIKAPGTTVLSGAARRRVSLAALTVLLLALVTGAAWVWGRALSTGTSSAPTLPAFSASARPSTTRATSPTVSSSPGTTSASASTTAAPATTAPVWVPPLTLPPRTTTTTAPASTTSGTTVSSSPAPTTSSPSSTPTTPSATDTSTVTPPPTTPISTPP